MTDAFIPHRPSLTGSITGSVCPAQPSAMGESERLTRSSLEELWALFSELKWKVAHCADADYARSTRERVEKLEETLDQKAADPHSRIESTAFAIRCEMDALMRNRKPQSLSDWNRNYASPSDRYAEVKTLRSELGKLRDAYNQVSIGYKETLANAFKAGYEQAQKDASKR